MHNAYSIQHTAYSIQHTAYSIQDTYRDYDTFMNSYNVSYDNVCMIMMI